MENSKKVTRTMVRWKKQDEAKVKKFFSMTHTLEEKEKFASELGRNYTSVYAKYKDILKKEKRILEKNKLSDKKDNNNNNNIIDKIPLEKETIVVTHINPGLSVPTIIRLENGVSIETFSSKIKINDVFIEV